MTIYSVQKKVLNLLNPFFLKLNVRPIKWSSKDPLPPSNAFKPVLPGCPPGHKYFARTPLTHPFNLYIFRHCPLRGQSNPLNAEIWLLTARSGAGCENIHTRMCGMHLWKPATSDGYTCILVVVDCFSILLPFSLPSMKFTMIIQHPEEEVGQHHSTANTPPMCPWFPGIAPCCLHSLWFTHLWMEMCTHTCIPVHPQYPHCDLQNSKQTNHCFTYLYIVSIHRCHLYLHPV